MDDPEIMAQLSDAKLHGAEFLKNAPLGIVVCADTTKSDVCVEDCSIAAIIIQLTALSLGLGSCWAQMRKRKHSSGMDAESFVRDLLGMPEQIMVEAIIGIGYPAEIKTPVQIESLQREKIRRNSWSGK